MLLSVAPFRPLRPHIQLLRPLFTFRSNSDKPSSSFSPAPNTSNDAEPTEPTDSVNSPPNSNPISIASHYNAARQGYKSNEKIPAVNPRLVPVDHTPLYQPNYEPVVRTHLHFSSPPNPQKPSLSEEEKRRLELENPYFTVEDFITTTTAPPVPRPNEEVDGSNEIVTKIYFDKRGNPIPEALKREMVRLRRLERSKRRSSALSFGEPLTPHVNQRIWAAKNSGSAKNSQITRNDEEFTEQDAEEFLLMQEQDAEVADYEETLKVANEQDEASGVIKDKGANSSVADVAPEVSADLRESAMETKKKKEKAIREIVDPRYLRITYIYKPDCSLCQPVREIYTRLQWNSRYRAISRFRDVDISKPLNEKWATKWMFDIPVLIIEQTEKRGHSTKYFMHRITYDEVETEIKKHLKLSLWPFRKEDEEEFAIEDERLVELEKEAEEEFPTEFDVWKRRGIVCRSSHVWK